jgi:hypothetical protein
VPFSSAPLIDLDTAVLLTLQACDALSFLTGNYVKSTIHRVSLPPCPIKHPSHP